MNSSNSSMNSSNSSMNSSNSSMNSRINDEEMFVDNTVPYTLLASDSSFRTLTHNSSIEFEIHAYSAPSCSGTILASRSLSLHFLIQDVRTVDEIVKTDPQGHQEAEPLFLSRTILGMRVWEFLLLIVTVIMLSIMAFVFIRRYRRRMKRLRSVRRLEDAISFA